MHQRLNQKGTLAMFLIFNDNHEKNDKMRKQKQPHHAKVKLPKERENYG